MKFAEPIPNSDIVAPLHHVDELGFGAGPTVHQVANRLVALPPREDDMRAVWVVSVDDSMFIGWRNLQTRCDQI